MEMVYVDTKKTLYALYKGGKITMWQASLIFGYINRTNNDEAMDKKAVKLIDALHKHKVIDDTTCYAMMNRYGTYCSGCEYEVFLPQQGIVSHSFVDPFPVSLFYYLPGGFVL